MANELIAVRRLIADDAHALTFQTFGQYRTALLKAVDALALTAPVAPDHGAQAVAKWIDDPHDIEQGQMLNPEWLKLHGVTAAQAIAASPEAAVARTQDYPPLPSAVAYVLGLAKYAHSSNIFAAHEFTPDAEHADEWEALHTEEQMHAYVDFDRKERQLSACNFCLSQAAKARALLVGLGQRDLVSVTADVDQRVSVIATGAEEEDSVLVNIGLNGLEHDSKTAAAASPHGSAPFATGDGTPATRAAPSASLSHAQVEAAYSEWCHSTHRDPFVKMGQAIRAALAQPAPVRPPMRHISGVNVSVLERAALANGHAAPVQQDAPAPSMVGDATCDAVVEAVRAVIGGQSASSDATDWARKVQRCRDGIRAAISGQKPAEGEKV